LQQFVRIITPGGKLLQPTLTLEDFPTFRIETGHIAPKAFCSRVMIRDVPGAQTKNIRRAAGPLRRGAFLLGTNRSTKRHQKGDRQDDGGAERCRLSGHGEQKADASLFREIWLRAK
jgi:hypothetical protein